MNLVTGHMLQAFAFFVGVSRSLRRSLMMAMPLHPGEPDWAKRASRAIIINTLIKSQKKQSPSIMTGML